MKVCPHCGKEYPDKSQYCLECGTLLEKKLEPPRDSILDHLKYGFNIVTKRPKVFLPTVLVYVIFFVLGIALVLSVGLSTSFFTDASAIDNMEFSGTSMLLFLVFILVVIYIGLVYEPFIQHIYITATTDNEINMRVSLRYAHSRLLAFLGAYLLAFVVAIPVIAFWMSKLPYDAVMNFEAYETEIFWSYGWPLLLFVPLGILYQLALNLMVWADLGFFKAVSESVQFIKHSYVKLIVVFVLQILASGLSTRVPFGGILMYIVYVMLSLSTIDIYRRYKDTGVDAPPLVDEPTDFDNPISPLDS